MRLLYVYPLMVELGGAERVLIQKMNVLAISGFEVFFLTYNQGGHPLPFKLAEDVRYMDLNVCTHTQYQYKGFRRVLEHFKRIRLLRSCLRKKVRELNPDIIITSTAGDFPILCKCRGINTAIVVESHGGYHQLVDYKHITIWNRLDLYRRYRCLRKVNSIVVLTEADAKRWRKHYQQVFIIPNIVKINTTGRYSSLENKRIIFAGRFVKVKGITELIMIWKQIHLRHPDWQLDMYGNGDDTELLGINGIHVHAVVPDLIPYYCEGSMLLLTSLSESFGLVMPEAMSCGLPIVAFETDGSSSIITNEVDGFIIENRNCDAFVKRVCQLIENVELRREMGRCAIEKAQRYSVERIIPQWKLLFESLVEKK